VTSPTSLLAGRDDVIAYLGARNLLDRLGESDAIEVDEVTAGNMNRVFIARGPVGSLAVKQAPPFVQAAGPGWPMDPARIGAEARAYQRLAELAPDVVPAVLLVDLDSFVLVMEDLSALRVLRDVLVDEVTDAVAGHPASRVLAWQVGETVGRFVGELSFATNELLADPATRDSLIAESRNDALCQLTVDVVLDEPYREHEHNRWHPALESRIRALYADYEVAAAVARIRTRFGTAEEALLHGDLHTGSVMTGGDEDRPVTKVFDPEFSFVGPIGMDLGLFWANMMIAATAATAVGADSLGVRRLSAITESWRAFTAVWEGNWTGPAAELRDRLTEIRADAWRFAGVEAIRRVAGWSHAADLETLPDELVGPASILVFDRAREWILEGDDTFPRLDR